MKEEKQVVNITLKDGSVKAVAKGMSIADFIKNELGMGLFKAACAARVNKEVKDLRDSLEEDASLDILTFDTQEGKEAFWHTSSHMLAQAVKRLYPEAKLSIGPAIEHGFYYDFDVEKPFSPEQLLELEKEMKKIAKEDLSIERFYLNEEEALKWAKENNEPYKEILLKEHAADGEKLSFYKQGEFTDLCAGPHLMKTGVVKAIKLTQTTGAYWKGDSENQMLCRVYGVTFPKASMLEEHLKMLEEAAKRDHRRLGRELDLFDIFEEGPGFPFFFPKGMVLRNALESYWKEEHKKAGYSEIKTPMMLNRELWETSGHWFNYKENMYTTTIDDTDFAIKPMNCPGGILVYKRKINSYRDLPLRTGELGHVHRHELSGALHGLMRVRAFTQDDAHIYCTEEQIKDEIIGVIELADKIYKTFGFEYKVELSTRPEKSMGEQEQWDIATDGLREALEALEMPYELNEGDGAFYGPKIDFHLKDAIGRTWQCGTIQLDFQLPQRFEMSYIGADGEKHQPVMLHRTIFGSIERFIGILTEHYAGAFPAWLAPVQVKLIPISEKHLDYANKVAQELEDKGIRLEVDGRSEKMGYKIREAQLEKIPYMLIMGDKEVEENSVGVRSRKEGDLGALSVEEFAQKLLTEIKEKNY